jgi:hypothetical protein
MRAATRSRRKIGPSALPATERTYGAEPSFHRGWQPSRHGRWAVSDRFPHGGEALTGGTFYAAALV